MRQTALDREARPLGSGFRVWANRLLFLVLFGDDFGRLSGPAFILGLIFLFDQPIHQIVDEITSAGHEISLANISQSQNLQTWVQATFSAALAIHFLRTQPYADRKRYRMACAAFFVAMFLFNPKAMLYSLPFLNFGLSVFSFLIGTAFVTAYVQGFFDVPEVSTLGQSLLNSLRTIRHATSSESSTEPSNTKVIAAAVAKVQATRIAEAEPITTEAKDVQRKHTAWESSIPYNRLVGDGIRLLEAVSHDAVLDKVPEFRLKNVALADVENQYTAVSYCWGKSAENKAISLDGVLVPVTTNLFETLKELRSHGYNLFWVDAISINQLDMQERSEQVLRIKAIFQKAREVVAWLGTEDAGSRRIMARLKTMSEGLQRHSHQDDHSLDDLKRFMAREFWRRVWIIQELAVGTQVFVVCCNEKVPLEKIQSLLDERVDRHGIDEKDWPDFLEEKQLIENILDIRVRRNDPAQSLSLLEALMKTKASISTRSHDRVFGLLGLASDPQFFVAEPNYLRSEVDICLDMTKSFIQSRQSLDIIIAAPRQGGKHRLPSWCPDYLNVASSPISADIIKYLSGKDRRHRLGVIGPYWKSTEPSHAIEKESFWYKDDVLRVSAVHVGRVDATGPVTGQNERPFYTMRRETTIGHRKRQKSDAGSGAQSVYNALSRILLLYDPKYTKFTTAPIALGMLFHFLSAYDMYAALKGGAAEEVLAWRKANADFQVHGRSLQHRAQVSALRMSRNFMAGLFDLGSRTMTFFDYPHMTKAVADIVREGLKLITIAGGGVGWGHSDTNLGDDIFLLTGCSLPVVLRECSDREAYQIVGHAYVDGYMDGKKWSETPPEKRVVVDIC